MSHAKLKCGRPAEQAHRQAAKLEKDLRAAIRPPLGPPLQLAERYAAGRLRRLRADDGADMP